MDDSDGLSTAEVIIDAHTLELPEEEGRALFLAAVNIRRNGGPLAITTDTMIAVTPSTQMSITIKDGFIDEYDPIGLQAKVMARAGVRAY